MKECMFCYQCQETAKNTGCTVSGVCGKKPETANRMDELIRQLKLLALTRKPDRELGLFAVQSLFMTITNANFDEARIAAQLERAKELTGRPRPGLRSACSPAKTRISVRCGSC